jgi:hypothetical protein
MYHHHPSVQVSEMTAQTKGRNTSWCETYPVEFITTAGQARSFIQLNMARGTPISGTSHSVFNRDWVAMSVQGNSRLQRFSILVVRKQRDP